jgi:membrane protease YdiL (CAAX protease family)
MPEQRTGRKWYLVEALGLSALVAMYIWKWQAVSPRSWWILAAWMVLSAVLRRDTPKTLGWRRFTGYLAFCLLQQVALNSFLTNRLLSYFGAAWPAAVLAGVLFAALHWPNPVLVPLTLVGGVAMTWLFARERNILPLALGQAVLGALVWWAFPLAWHHSMRVGPGFWAFHP